SLVSVSSSSSAGETLRKKDPTSTTAKILQYLKEHPGSRQQQIATGIQKSRGSVAYQLYRLMNESEEVDTIDVQNGTDYYLKLDEISPPAILMCAALEKPHLREILELLHQHPHLTHHQIAQIWENPPTPSTGTSPTWTAGPLPYKRKGADTSTHSLRRPDRSIPN
ncbi:MAG: winged helix-turn-helix domain-containing protein, partial [Methanocorpusculum sp.]|nr:winged helix-turn-helix domain-containing protein [Methanocorpusculum sp.]